MLVSELIEFLKDVPDPKNSWVFTREIYETAMDSVFSAEIDPDGDVILEIEG